MLKICLVDFISLGIFPFFLMEDSFIAMLIEEQQSYMILPPPSKVTSLSKIYILLL